MRHRCIVRAFLNETSNRRGTLKEDRERYWIAVTTVELPFRPFRGLELTGTVE